MELLIPVAVWGGVILLGIFALAIMFSAFYKKVPQGYALIVNDMSSKPKVHFTGGMVLPVIHKMEVMKISLITLEIDRRASDGLICKDNLRADITVAFYLRVNETQDDVLRVAKAIGVDRASDKEAVNELFNAKFSEALKTVGKKMAFLDLFENRILFREKIIEVIGDDLNGYVLEDVAIDYLEQTPKARLDPTNILDSEGIRKITEITAQQNIETNRLEKDETLAITKKNVETQEALLALERQQVDAESRQKREIETVRAREEAETKKVQEEERLKSEQARIETEEQIEIREQVRLRQVEVAEKNRERAVVIEKEKVIKAQEMESVNRQREVELSIIDKDKALEEEKKIIAQTISERIAVDKKVAEEEERIKEVQQVSEADRLKQVKILAAEASAQEDLVHTVKQAEAEEQKAQFKAREINLLAQAELEAASKKAEAEKKVAEGTQATQAANGLAQAKVMLAKADATEKEGLVEARVTEVKAEAMQKEGLAQAKVMEEKLVAEARGKEQLGRAEAIAEKEIGLSQAQILLEKGKAEASALIEKFAAMNDMNKESREFEEFRMNLEYQLKEVLASIDANKQISADQAQVLAAALKNANIDIVGGQGDYFDKLAKGMGAGNAINGFMEKSPIVQALMEKLLGGASEPKQISNVEKSES
ncbi:flotillin family protein [Aliikangiella maris]|uniref:Flotillin family protein n=2 Tax=Aliikangiella maris TaxID=3162458 RepID=A0ABV2BX58_9GAMM